MVNSLFSGSSGSGSSPGRGHCVVFLGKTLYSHSASLHSGIYMGTGEFNINAGVTLRWTSISFRGSRNTPSRHSLCHEINSGLMGHLARMQP